MATQLIATEFQEQCAVVEWLRLRKVCFAHIPNGSDASVQYRVKLKKLGLSAGFPDLIIPQPPRLAPYKAVALEMKRKKGGAWSDDQKRWADILETFGWHYILAHGAGEAIERLTQLGY